MRSPRQLVAPPNPPLAARHPHQLVAHGDVRVDDWYWLRERDNPEVIAHLEAENAYTEACLAEFAPLQETLFAGIRDRVQEDDVSAPSRQRSFWYWSATATGAQYRTHHRLADPERHMVAAEVLEAARSGSGELLLDENALGAGQGYFALGVFDLSGDDRILAYATDVDGSERYRLRFRDLLSGEDLADVIEDVHYSSAWAADNERFCYVRTDEAMRPYQVWCHHLGTPEEEDRLLFSEDDERFFVAVGLTRSERFIVVSTQSKMTSEERFCEASAPVLDPQVILPRRHGVEYDVSHAVLPGKGDVWLVRSNAPDPAGEPATNFSVSAVPIGSDGAAEVLIAHRPEVKIEAVDAFAGHIVIAERVEGLERLRVITLSDGAEHVIVQPEPVYSLAGGMNAEWDATTYRFGYTSLTTPMSSIDYDVRTRSRAVVKVQAVLGGYDPGAYRTERIWAEAPDGTGVPVSLVCRRDQALDGSAPCLLYGYGSYEITIDPAFSSARLNLLERGVVFAIAHVRGGGELGRRWYEQGRLEHKTNTFTDFVACAEHLVARGYTSADRLSIRGGSAGGLLMGAVTNMRPELFAAVVAEVPFVDVVTTMSDDTLPLTVTEWEEWGNPVEDPVAYATMKSYSPYDNVPPAPYPAMYITAGLNDPRVGFWEPAKWVAKLRVTTTGDAPILLRTELGAGHGGASGRYDAWRDEARVQCFVLGVLGITG